MRRRLTVLHGEIEVDVTSVETHFDELHNDEWSEIAFELIRARR